ncbi:MAG TPA: rhodanese-like domain-containing protein, partial [Pyrinomonadaceae bacterium]|nr:rhodanese-like domain-containing protein [Pyrinomonadaceae bacterium]
MKHSEEFLAVVEDAKTRIREVTVAETLERTEAGAVLIDVREDNEWQTGHATDAIHLGRGVIERDIVGQIPNKDKEIILY